MQQNQSERRFSDNPQQQPVYRFPQNQTMQGWQSQQSFSDNAPAEEVPLSRHDQRVLKRAHKKKRRIFTIWNLFAVIGIITVLLQGIRYIIIPFLVYLNVLSGGVL